MEDKTKGKAPSLTSCEEDEHRQPEFVLLIRARERRAVEKAKAAMAKVKHAIEQAAPFPGAD